MAEHLSKDLPSFGLLLAPGGLHGNSIGGHTSPSAGISLSSLPAMAEGE